MRSLTLNPTFKLSVTICWLCAVVSYANKVESEQESCRVYAGGQVYPQERRTSEHALHWSKAQSKSAARSHVNCNYILVCLVLSFLVVNVLSCAIQLHSLCFFCVCKVRAVVIKLSGAETRTFCGEQSTTVCCSSSCSGSSFTFGLFFLLCKILF